MDRVAMLFLLLQTSVLFRGTHCNKNQHCGKPILFQSNSPSRPSLWMPVCKSPDLWICWNYDGKCINQTSVCDGWEDCLHGEDEWKCEEKEDQPCPPGQVKCGLTKICLSLTKHCDRVKDCPGGEDEAVCPPNFPQPVICDTGLFSCDGVCKPAFMKCNGKLDCFDRTDEPGPIACANESAVYQVSGIAVTVERAIYDTLAIKWWMDKLNTSKPIEFLPKLCDVESNACGVVTNWTRNMDYLLTNANLNITILPFWKYNVMIIVRVGTVEYHPGVLKEVQTAPGGNKYRTPDLLSINVGVMLAQAIPENNQFLIPLLVPGRPYDLGVQQTTTSEFLLTWKRPSYINGHFSLYTVYSEPQLPIWMFEAQTPSLIIPIHPQLPEGNYTLWVTVRRRSRWNELNDESTKSEPIIFILNNVSPVQDGLQVVGLNDSQVSLAWNTTGSKVDNFTVTVVSPEYYNKQFYNKVTKDKRITIAGLNPGTKYNITVTPVYNGVLGLSGSKSVIVNTLGSRPARLDSFAVHCEGSTSVSLHWNISDHKESNQYIILFWKSDGSFPILSKIAETSGPSSPIYIDDLEPCETYYFDIFVQVNHLFGPPTHLPTYVKTGMNTTAPPEGIDVLFRPENPMQLTVIWRAACPILEEELNYTIVYRELTRINTSFVEVNVTGGTKTKLQWNVPRNYGAAYELKIRTAVEASRFSDIVYFQDPVIPFVEAVTQLTLSDTLLVVINFTLPIFPPLVLQRGKPKYYVWLSNDITFKDPQVTKSYRTENHWFRFDYTYFKEGLQYYAAVSVEDGFGYKSPMSKPLLLHTTLTTNIVPVVRLLSSMTDIFIIH